MLLMRHTETIDQTKQNIPAKTGFTEGGSAVYQHQQVVMGTNFFLLHLLGVKLVTVSSFPLWLWLRPTAFLCPSRGCGSGIFREYAAYVCASSPHWGRMNVPMAWIAECLLSRIIPTGGFMHGPFWPPTPSRSACCVVVMVLEAGAWWMPLMKAWHGFPRARGQGPGRCPASPQTEGRKEPAECHPPPPHRGVKTNKHVQLVPFVLSKQSSLPEVYLKILGPLTKYCLGPPTQFYISRPHYIYNIIYYIIYKAPVKRWTPWIFQGTPAPVTPLITAVRMRTYNTVCYFNDWGPHLGMQEGPDCWRPFSV